MSRGGRGNSNLVGRAQPRALVACCFFWLVQLLDALLKTLPFCTHHQHILLISLLLDENSMHFVAFVWLLA
jgi:hypothetical protein